MVRSGPEAVARALDIVVDSYSVHAKHGGDLTGPNSTDQSKSDTKYYIVVSTEGLPLGAVASAASNVGSKLATPAWCKVRINTIPIEPIIRS
jgi:hypothetical protein